MLYRLLIPIAKHNNTKVGMIFIQNLHLINNWNNLIATCEEKLPTLSEFKCGYWNIPMPNTGLKTKILRQCIKCLAIRLKRYSVRALHLKSRHLSVAERKADESGDSGSFKRSAKGDSIDLIVQTWKKHGKDYNPLQYQMWARMKHKIMGNIPA